MFYQQLAHFCRCSPKASLAQTTQTQGAADGSSRCLHEILLLERFPKAIALPHLWSFPQPKACCKLVLSFFFLSLLLPLAIHSTATNAFCRISALHVSWLPWGIWNLTGKAKYLPLLSIQQLFKGIFHSPSHVTYLSFDTRSQTPHQPLVAEQQRKP